MNHNVNHDIDGVLLRQAAELLAGTGFASVSMLQRKLRIGYDTATELMGELAHRGVVTDGPNRTVLIRNQADLDAALEDTR